MKNINLNELKKDLLQLNIDFQFYMDFLNIYDNVNYLFNELENNIEKTIDICNKYDLQLKKDKEFLDSLFYNINELVKILIQLQKIY